MKILSDEEYKRVIEFVNPWARMKKGEITNEEMLREYKRLDEQANGTGTGDKNRSKNS